MDSINATRELVKAGELPPRAVSLALIIHGFNANNKHAYPSQTWLAERLRVTRRTINRLVRRMRDLGVLTTTRRGCGTLVYHLKCLIAEPLNHAGSRRRMSHGKENASKGKNAAQCADDEITREPFLDDLPPEASLTRKKKRVGSATPEGGDPSNGSTSSARNTRQDPVIAALEQVEYNGQPGVSARGKVAAAAKRLWQDEYERETGKRLVRVRSAPGEFKRERQDALAAQVRTRASRYEDRWPDREITSTALVSAWDKLGPPRRQEIAENDGTVY